MRWMFWMNGWTKTGTGDLKRSVHFSGVGCFMRCCLDGVRTIPFHPLNFEFSSRNQLPRWSGTHGTKQGKKFIYSDILLAFRAIHRSGNLGEPQLGVLTDSAVGGYRPRPVQCLGHSSTQSPHFQRNLVNLSHPGSSGVFGNRRHHGSQQT